MKFYVFILYSFQIIVVLAGPTIISQSFQGNNFNDADGWNVINANAGFNECQGIKIFGGWGLFGLNAAILKQFEFPPHSSIYLKMTFYKFATWDGEYFYIWLDDQLVFRQSYWGDDGLNLCGRQGQFELQQQITLKIKHTGPQGIVMFTSSLDQLSDEEAWGIRDFEISVEKCPELCSACQEGDTAEVCKIWILDQIYWASKLADKILKEDWTVSGGSGSSNCGGVALLGGFSGFGIGASIRKTFYLRPHYRLKIKFLFAKIDSWDNENANLYVDGAALWKRTFRLEEGPWVNICGRSNFRWRELFTRIEIDVPHNSDRANIVLTSNLDEGPLNESWGIRDFYLYYASCSPNCIKCTGLLPKDCIQCLNDWVKQNGLCTAPKNFILVESSFWEDNFTSLEDWVLSVVGGYNSLALGATATKTFNLPTHTKLRIRLKIYKFDSWDNEWLAIKLNGVEVWKRYYNNQTGEANLCGMGLFNDHIEQVDEIVLHTQTELVMLIISNLSGTDETWGFREFELFYYQSECAIFYTECDYQGTTFEFCENSVNFQKDSVPPVIRSIKVPTQSMVTFFERPDYKGWKVSYTTNQNCINLIDFSFSVQIGGVEWNN